MWEIFQPRVNIYVTSRCLSPLTSIDRRLNRMQRLLEIVLPFSPFLTFSENIFQWKLFSLRFRWCNWRMEREIVDRDKTIRAHTHTHTHAICLFILSQFMPSRVLQRDRFSFSVFNCSKKGRNLKFHLTEKQILLISDEALVLELLLLN